MTGMMLQVCYALLASLSFGLLFNVRGIALLLSALGGGVGWGAYLALFALSGKTVLSFFVASSAISIYADSVARVRRDPVTIYLVPALIPIVPGSGMYYTVYEFLQGNTDRAVSSLLETFSIAIAIAIGIALASSVHWLVFRGRK
jgi:uncharacterized membrane protein YjjB (DUF3815 family)